MVAEITTSPLVKTYTLEEFWELPDPPDGSKLELIAGVLYMTPPPGGPHNNAASNLILLVSVHLVVTKKPGRLRFPRAAIWTSPNTYVEPDLFYVSAELDAQMDPDHPTSADWVVEILSPGTEVYDRATKTDTYAALDVRELWLVNPTDRTVEVCTLTEGRLPPGRVFKTGERIASTVFPDWTPLVDDIFK